MSQNNLLNTIYATERFHKSVIIIWQKFSVNSPNVFFDARNLNIPRDWYYLMTVYYDILMITDITGGI
jgi:hypothetical protein